MVSSKDPRKKIDPQYDRRRSHAPKEEKPPAPRNECPECHFIRGGHSVDCSKRK